MEKDKPQKYSLVTGEKIKKKSVKKIKKKHKAETKKEKKEDKKVKKQITRFKRKNSEVVDSEVESSEKPLPQTPQTKVLIVRKADEPVSRKRRVMSFISYVLVGFIAAFFGYISGNLYVANVLNKVDYSAFSEENLMADSAAIYGQVQAQIDKGVAIDRLDDTEEGFTAADIFVAAEYILNKQEHYYSEVSGEIQPSIGKKQIVWGFKEKNGSIYEVENVSKGMLSVGEQIYYDANSDPKQILVRKATKIGDRLAEYEKEPSAIYDYDGFRNEYGLRPETPIISYIISTKTMVEGTGSVTALGLGRYQISFSLTTDSSVINYIKQVKHMSGLPDYPTFNAIKVTAVVDSSLKFVSLRFDESYRVMYYGVMATCSGYMSNSFTY